MTADDTTETGTPAAEVANAPASAPKVGRNDACPCGSGKKFKKCCINDAAYNVVPETKVATSAKTLAKPAAANAGHPAAKQGGMKSASAAAVSKTSTRRKV